MSLPRKFHLAFAVMILLATITGGLILGAFMQTNAAIDRTRDRIDLLHTVLTPVNIIAAKVDADINQAGLFYHAFTFNRNHSDFNNGVRNVGQIRNRLIDMRRLLAQPDTARLACFTQPLDDAARIVYELENNAQALQDIFRTADTQQRKIDDARETMRQCAYDLLRENLDTITAQLQSPEADGRPDLIRTIDFLTRFLLEANKAQVLFWHGHAQNNAGLGDAAQRGEDVASLAEAGKTLDALKVDLAAFKTSPWIGPAEAERLEKLETTLNEYHQTIRDLVAIWCQIATLNATLANTTNRGLAAIDVIGRTATVLMEKNISDAHARAAHLANIVDGSMQIAGLALLTTVLLGVFLAHFATRRIVAPVAVVSARLREAETFIGGAAAGWIASLSDERAGNGAWQGSSLTETVAVLARVSAKTRDNAENARMASGKILRTAELASDGTTTMRRLSRALDGINERTGAFGRIVETITNLAFQVNRLALDTTGETGPGFAKVADEVRNLSDRSAQAAKDAASLFADATDSVRTGSALLTTLFSIHHDLENGVNGLKDLIGPIARTADEQAQDAERIDHSLAQMDKTTRRNAMTAEENAAAAHNLNQWIHDLRANIAALARIVDGANASDARAADHPFPPSDAHHFPSARRSVSGPTAPPPHV